MGALVANISNLTRHTRCDLVLNGEVPRIERRQPLGVRTGLGIELPGITRRRGSDWRASPLQRQNARCGDGRELRRRWANLYPRQAVGAIRMSCVAGA